MTPDLRPLISEVARQYPHLLEENTYESCGLFTAIVVAKAGDGWGHVGKSAGEKGWNPPGGPRVSHDAIWHRPSNQQVDILAFAAAANEGKRGPATEAWILIPQHEYRAGNEWTPPVLKLEPEPAPGPEPPPMQPPDPPRPAPGFDVAAAFANLWARLDQLQMDVSTLRKQQAVLNEHQHNFTDQVKAKVAEERDFLHQRVVEVRTEIIAAVQQIDKDASCVLRRR